MTIASLITAIASVVIAFYAWKNHELAKSFEGLDKLREKRDQEYRCQVSDLYQGIIIATLMGGQPSSGVLKESIATFKERYNGKTPIFKEV